MHILNHTMVVQIVFTTIFSHKFLIQLWVIMDRDKITRPITFRHLHESLETLIEHCGLQDHWPTMYSPIPGPFNSMSVELTKKKKTATRGPLNLSTQNKIILKNKPGLATRA